MKKIVYIAAGLTLLASCGNKSKLAEYNNENSEDAPTSVVSDSAQVEISEVSADSTPSSGAESVDEVQPASTQESLVSVLTFCSWDGSEKAMTFLDGSKVASKLKELGFTRKSDKVKWQGEDDASGEYIKQKESVYQLSENGQEISVEVEYNDFGRSKWVMEVDIEFPNAEMRDSFLQTVEANHYKKVSDTRYKGQSSAVYYTGTDIKVNGNKVKISIVGEA